MVILICIFPMISDVEHLLLHLLVIFISSLEKCLFEPFACFFFFLIVLVTLLYFSAYSGWG